MKASTSWTMTRGFAAETAPSKMSPEELEKKVVEEYEHVTGLEKEEIEGDMLVRLTALD